jgi:membrane protein
VIPTDGSLPGAEPKASRRKTKPSKCPVMSRLLAPVYLVLRVVRRFLGERLALTAAALSFDTLLGLVPMIVVGFSLFQLLPHASGMSTALEKFLLANLLPDKAGVVIAKHLGQFAQRAAGVPMVGAIAMVITALMQTLTIEHAFNTIWKIKTKRPLVKRISMHLIALLIGPLAFGGSLTLITLVAGVSFGLIGQPEWLSTTFFRILPIVLMTALFAVLYWGVPNRPVARWHALIGGTFAAVGFATMQRLFSLYVANLPTYTLMYGAFAAVPIFLSWLYLSWSVILVGALLVSELPAAARIRLAK